MKEENKKTWWNNNKKYVFGLSLTITLISGIMFIYPFHINDDSNITNNTFTTDVYSFDNSIIFIMNAKNVIVEPGFSCYINGEKIDSSCYTVYHETNDTYAQKTFIKVFCNTEGTNFTDGQIVHVEAYYSSPDWSFDFYSCEICSSYMKINYGWYPYSCY